MARRRCACCGKLFRLQARTSDQRFCGAAVCQRERRRRWQAARRRDDRDYRDNQRQAQQAWSAQHPDYWRQYRADHPDYVERNRAASRERRHRHRLLARFAKMDASAAKSAVPSGTYRLVPASSSGFAKMDAWTVELTVLSTACGDFAEAVLGFAKEDPLGSRAPSC